MPCADVLLHDARATLGVLKRGVVYYPFGLTFNSFQRENSVDQRWKFQGQEHIDDLGLNWDSFKWRNHQPDIGRFFNIDPLADDYVHNSPYAFSENKVVSHVELEGLESVNVNSRSYRAARYGGNSASLRNAASEAARIANRPPGFVTMTPRESTYFRRTTRYSLNRGGGASNNYGRTPNAGDESNADNTHSFGNRSGNALKVALDIADNAKSIINSAGEIRVVESFSEPGFYLGSDIIVGNEETTYQLNQLDNAFNQAVFGIAMDGMSHEEWSNLKPGERLLRLGRAYMSAGPSPSQMAREKAEEAKRNSNGESEETSLPFIKPQEWQLRQH